MADGFEVPREDSVGLPRTARKIRSPSRFFACIQTELFHSFSTAKQRVVFWTHLVVKRPVEDARTDAASSELVNPGAVMKAVISGLLGLLCMSSIACADEYGVATYYFHPRFPTSFIAAHKHLPMGSRVRVHDLDNGRHVDVTIVDRGPFAGPSRIIDLSTVAANALGIRSAGVAHVRLQRL